MIKIKILMLLRNRAVAFIFTGLFMTAAVGWLGGNDLLALENRTRIMFDNSLNATGAGAGPAGQISHIVGQTKNMAFILDKYSGAQAYVSILSGDVGEGNASLRQAVADVNAKADAALAAYGVMESFHMTETDENYMHGIMAEMNAAKRILLNSGYNETAAAFNQTVGRFPANVIAMVRKIKPLPLFFES